MKQFLVLLFVFLQFSSFSQKTDTVFKDLDVFDLQYVSNPQISPDGSVIIYRRMSFDILKDRSIGNLWIINSDGTNHQKLTSIESSRGKESDIDAKFTRPLTYIKADL